MGGGEVYVGREGVGNRSGRGICVGSSGLRVSLGLECDLRLRWSMSKPYGYWRVWYDLARELGHTERLDK